MSELPSSSEPNEGPSAFDRLDQLIGQAYEPSKGERLAQELQVVRLQCGWLRQRQSMRRRRRTRSFAVAASIAVVGFLGWSLMHPPRELPVVLEPPAPESATKARDVVAADMSIGIPPSIGQPPDPLREMLFTVRSPRGPRQLVSLSQVLASRVSLPPAAARREILATTGWRAEELHHRLFTEVPTLPAETQRLAIAILAEERGVLTIKTLQRLAQQEGVRPLCLEHLFAMTDGRNPAVLLEAAPTRELAGWLLQDAANDPRRFDCLLSLVSHSVTRGEALGAIREMDEPPVALLLAAIDSDQRHVRVAAALALGHLGGAEVAEPLIELVTSHDRRNIEVWLAIIKCDSRLAEEFLAYAARYPLLLGHYNAARLRQQQLSP